MTEMIKTRKANLLKLQMKPENIKIQFKNIKTLYK